MGDEGRRGRAGWREVDRNSQYTGGVGEHVGSDGGRREVPLGS